MLMMLLIYVSYGMNPVTRNKTRNSTCLHNIVTNLPPFLFLSSVEKLCIADLYHINLHFAVIPTIKQGLFRICYQIGISRTLLIRHYWTDEKFGKLVGTNFQSVEEVRMISCIKKSDIKLIWSVTKLKME